MFMLVVSAVVIGYLNPQLREAGLCIISGWKESSVLRLGRRATTILLIEWGVGVGLIQHYLSMLAEGFQVLFYPPLSRRCGIS